MPNRPCRLAEALVILAGTGCALASAPFPPVLDLASLNGATGFTLEGLDALDGFGASTSSAGDVNGDGVEDLVIGVIRGDPGGRVDAGEVVVVFGGAGVGAAGSIDVAGLDGSNGFVLNGIAVNDRAGRSVSSAGDVNGDGVGDLIIGAELASPGGRMWAGQSYVVFGGPGIGAGGVFELSSLDGSNGFAINGVANDDRSGYAVSSAGDVNGDGFGDVIVGAYNADPDGKNRAGETYVVFGGPGVGAGGVVELSSLDGSNGFTLRGIAASDFSGFSVSSAGDLNADGVDDVMIGAFGADPGGRSSAGVVYVVFGGAGVGAGGVLELSSLDGANGFTANGVDAGDNTGGSLSAAGDVNGDGLDEVIISAFFADPGGRDAAGESYVVFGGAGLGAGGELELSSLDGSNGFVLNGIDTDDGVSSVSSAGDMNGDGFDDLLHGAQSADPNGASSAGESYVVFGGSAVGAGGAIELSSLNGATGFVLNGVLAGDASGVEVSSAGDVNGDGLDDVMISATGADPGGVNLAGEVAVVFGRPFHRWSDPAGGAWNTSTNWECFVVPARGVVVIETAFGVTVTGPTGVLFADTIRLGASAGRTTLELVAGSLVSVERSMTIPDSAALTGAGVFATPGRVIVDGLLRADDLDVLAGEGVSIEPGGRFEVKRALVQDGVINAGDLELQTIAKGAPANELEVFGVFVNTDDGDMLAQGDAILRFRNGLETSGDFDLVSSNGLVTGDVAVLEGALSALQGSVVILADNVDNQATIVVSADSAIEILGELKGNGITAAAGGVAGPTTVRGGVRPGPASAPGEAVFEGDLALGDQGTTVIEIAGPSQLDRVTTTADLAVGGTLTVTLVDGYVPQPGDVYDVLDFASLTGSFSSVQLDQALIDAGADVSDLLVTGEIRVPGELCPGDVDGDNDTDIFDFAELALAFGTMPGDTNWNPDADLVPNGTIDVFDFATLAEDFGCSG